MKKLISAIFATLLITSCVSQDNKDSSKSHKSKSKTVQRTRQIQIEPQTEQTPEVQVEVKPEEAPTTTMQIEQLDEEDADSTAIPYLGDNFSTFHTPSPVPAKNDSAFCFESNQFLEDQELNYQKFEEGLKSIKVSCLHLILGGSKSNPIFQRLRKTINVKKLVLIAETLEINDQIHIAGGDVEIRAKKVIFGQNGAILTTPESLTERAELKADGKDGLPGGNVSIFADVIVDENNPNSIPRIITNGGNGQEAGPGIDGKPGRNADVVIKRKNITFIQRWVCYGSHNRSGTNCHWQTYKKGKPSTNGEDAVIGGTPGAAGKPGQIKIEVRELGDIEYSSKTGQPGLQDRVRHGGPAGKPETTCKRMYAAGGKEVDYDCITASKGKDAEPKHAKQSPSEEKMAKYEFNTDRSYLSTELLNLQNKYAKLLFLNGHHSLSNKYFQTIDAQFSDLEDIGAKFSAQHSVAQANLLKLDANRDYFGNEITWTPNIAFDLNFKVFKNEIYSSLKQVYLSRSILAKANEVESKRMKLSLLKDTIADSVHTERMRIKDAIDQTSNLKSLIEGIKTSEEELQYQIKKLEKEFASEARNNLEPSSEEKMLNTVKVLSQVVPVGQPTFRTIGFGIQLLQDLRKPETNLAQMADRLYERSADIEQMDTEKAMKDLGKKLASFSVDKFLNARTSKDRIAMLNDFYRFASPIYNGLKQTGSLLSKQEVPQSALEAEIARIRNSSKRFKKAITALGKLHASKKLFLQTYNNTKLSISSGLANINSSFQKLAQIEDQLEDTSMVKSSELNSLLSEVESDSIERIDYYHYLLAKSYEYQFLTPYRRKFNHVALADKIQNLIKQQEDTRKIEFSELFVFVNDEIDALTRTIVIGANGSTSSFTQEKFYDLNEEQIAQLSQGKAIYLDLTKFFDESEVNVRLHKVCMENVTTANGESFTLNVAHSGKSIFSKAGKQYLFTHSDVNNPNLHWSTNVSSSGEVSCSTASMDEIISLDEDLDLSLNYFVKPSGRTYLEVKLNEKVDLTSGSLKIRYDYKK